ncbi:hypothetical protein ACQV2B_18980 [Pantoea allii]|uniref:hypothetical protein n=1 Tax=Pantoea allii TaxID=574096 RepID=UPI003D3212A3
MSLFGSVADAIGSVFGDKSWTDIIGTGLKVGGSLLSNHAQSQASQAQYQNQLLSADSQLVQSTAQLRAAAAEQQDGVYKQIEYNRLAQEARDNAARATATAAQKAYLIRRQGKETAENALAGYAASGVVAGTGTAAYVPAFINGRAGEDAFSAFQEGQDSADQYSRQADAYVNAGNQARSASDTAATGIREQADALSQLSAATRNIAGQNYQSAKTSGWASLLGSAGNIASQWFS